MTGGPLVAYAFVVGLTGLINPCGLPLLPAYLTFFVDDVERPWPTRLMSALRSGGCLSLGFVAVFAIVGLIEASFAAAVGAFAPWLMLVVGAAIAVFGALALFGKAPSLRLPALTFRSGRGTIAMTGFGAVYALGSLSCSLPVFVAAVGSVLTGTSPLLSVAVFVAYALGMGLFATAASVIAAFGGAAVLRVFRSAARILPRAAGAVCVVVGIYLLAYWAHALGAPDAAAPIVGAIDGLQSSAVAWLDAWWLPVAAACCLAVLAALLALGAAGGARTRAHSSGASLRRTREGERER